MPLITNDEKAEKEVQELAKAWAKLRLIPEYIQDYKLYKKSNISQQEQERIKNTWGFFPLSNPEKDISFEFQSAFSDYDDKVSQFISPLNWNGLDFYSVKNGKLYDPNNYYVRKLEGINPKIKLEVDLTKRVTVLVKQFISFQ